MQTDELNILLVEDEEDDAILVRELLSQYEPRWRLWWAKSAADALALCANHDYDAILLDYRLGGFDTGTDLLRQMRASGNDTPVVFLTGYGNEEIAVMAMKAGAADYLPKSHLSGLGLSAAIRYARVVHRKPHLGLTAVVPAERRSEVSLPLEVSKA